MKEILFLAIDPGQTGALVGLSLEGKMLERHPMGDIQWFCSMLRHLKGKYHGLVIGLEWAQFFSGQGGVSAFNYGDHFGSLKGAMAMAELSFTLIRPQSWTKVMHVRAKGDTAKKKSLFVVKKLFPNDPLYVEGNKRKTVHKGIVDALAMAEFVRRQYLAAMQPSSEIETCEKKIPSKKSFALTPSVTSAR